MHVPVRRCTQSTRGLMASLILNTPFFWIGLVKGLNEVCKCLDRKQAILCILAEDCNDPKYKKLVDVSTNLSIADLCILSRLSPRLPTSLWSRLKSATTSVNGSDTASMTPTEHPRRSREPPPLPSRTTAKKLRPSPSCSTTSRKRDLATEIED